VIFAFPRSFSIDGQRGISDPVGMSGVRLEVETHVVTAATSLKQNIDRCVRAAGVLPKLFILEPVAAAAAVCSEAEQRNGVILVDAGAGHTDVEVFVSGAPYLTAAVPIGGGHVTRDIAIGLNTSEQQAETLKTRYGTTLVESVAEDEVIEFLAADGVSHESAPRRLLAEIIAARVEELFEHLIRVLSRARCLDKVPSGVVLTGGASLLPGFPEMAQRSFGVVPVRVGRPRPVKGHTELIADPAYAVALGLILNGARLVHGDAVRTQPTPESGVGHWLRRILHRG
jgi:cell division protein FtsA